MRVVGVGCLKSVGQVILRGGVGDIVVHEGVMRCAPVDVASLGRIRNTSREKRVLKFYLK